MRNNFFDAISWLHKENHTASTTNETSFDGFPFIKNETKDSSYSPHEDLFLNYLNPEELKPHKNLGFQKFISKQLALQLEQLVEDIIPQVLYSYPSFTKSLKAQLENEFKVYTSLHNHSHHTPNSFSDLFSDFKKSQEQDQIHPLFSEFLKFYAMRMASFSVLRLKFLLTICQGIGHKLTLNESINPSFLLSQIFPKGSSKELSAAALTAHLFSWYRPSGKFYKNFESLIDVVKNNHLSSVIGTIVSKTLIKEETKAYFSDSVSNPNFGHFIRTILLSFPSWIKNAPAQDTNFPINHFLHVKQKEELITTKVLADQSLSLMSSLFRGDDESGLSSFTTLGMNTPTFFDFLLTSEEDTFCRYLFEIKFLTEMALYYQQETTIDLIKKIAGLSQSKNNSFSKFENQDNLFPEFGNKRDEQYNRIILNLMEYPKNNPHFYLFNQIMEQEKSLKDDGYLVIFSSKKLFILSQREKIDHLLKSYKLEGSISFDKLKGRGDLPPFIYIFSKRKQIKKSWSFGTNNTGFSQLKKNPCLSFRVCGEISSICEYKEINQAFMNFFESRSPEATPLYQYELDNGSIFEFFQDAILDGRLINSSSKDSGQITHPSFFKHLIKSGLPLDHFFYLENIKTEKPNTSQLSFFDGQQIPFNYQGQYPYVLVVDLRNSDFPRIEIITDEAYKGKLKEYGSALCHYFGMIPKVSGLNINHFRLFFRTSIAGQIVSLSLNGPTSKVKAKVSSILIPKFFSTHESPPIEIMKELETLSNMIEENKGVGPGEIEKQLAECLPSINQGLTKYPWSYFSFLSHIFFYFDEQKNKTNIDLDNIDFRNPILIKKLIALPQKSILPKNDDVYLQFLVKHHSELHMPLKNIALISKKDIINQTGEVFLLELKAENNASILEIHSDYHLLSFINFLLKNTSIGIPISTIIQNLKIPGRQELNKVILDFVNDASTFGHMAQIVDELIEKILKQQILNLH